MNSRIWESLRRVCQRSMSFVLTVFLIIGLVPMAAFTFGEDRVATKAPITLFSATQHTVDFMNGESVFDTQEVDEGDICIAPLAVPCKDDEHEFVGWYTEDNALFDFSTPITASLVLHAAYREIFPVVDPLSTAFKVTFMNMGAFWGEIEVAQGEIIGDFSIPHEWPLGAVGFLCWSETDPDDIPNGLKDQDIIDAYEFAMDTPIEGDIVLHAIYSSTYLIKYKTAPGSEGVVYETARLLPAEFIIGPNEKPVPPENKRLLYWFVEEDYTDTSNPPAMYSFGDHPGKDMTLAPYFSDQWFVFFISDGTQVDFQTVTGGTTATVPTPPPTRLGYTFSHWSEERNGAAFDFNTAIDNTLTLYAVWTPQTVSYTVVYWLEVPNVAGTPVPGTLEQYAYEYSESRTGTAGAMTNVTGASTAAANSSTAMRYSTFQQANNTTIAGNGTTVVNVYMKRNVYTITFDLNNSNSSTTMLFKGTTYRGNGTAYSINVKYEQDISTIWPCEGTATFAYSTNGYRFVGWLVAYSTINSTSTSGNITWVTKRLVVTDEMLPRNPTSAGFTITAQWSNSATQKTVTYWIETYPGQDLTGLTTKEYNGKTYVKSESYSQSFYSTGNLNAKDIEGVKYVAGNSGTSNTTIYDFYYDRNRYTLSFNTMGGSVIAPVTGISYEQSLAGRKPTDPTMIIDAIPYSFEGWYLEPEYKTEFEDADFNTTTMPAHNLTLFARWASTAYTIEFYDDFTLAYPHEGKEVGKGLNEYLLESETPYSSGHIVDGRGTFAGWYFILAGIPQRFSYDTPITSDLQLHAAWLVDGYTVTYDLGAGTGTVPQDLNTYHLGKETRVADGIGIVAPTGYVFIGWLEANTNRFYYPGMIATLSGNADFVAQYGRADLFTSLTYHSNFPGTLTEQTVVWSVPKDSAVALPETQLFEYPGYKIIGWANQAGLTKDYELGGEYMVGHDAAYDVYAVWDFDGWTVTFNQGLYGTFAQGTDAEFPGIPDSTAWDDANIAIPLPTAEAGYRFIGWKQAPVSENSLIAKDDAGYFSTITISSNLTFIAQYTQLFSVTYNANDGAGAPIDSNKYIEDEQVTVSSQEPSRLGYSFAGWLYGSDIYDAGSTFSMPAADVTLIAHWEIDYNQVYKIEYVAGVGGSVDPASESHWASYTGANDGSLATANDGYKFINWTDAAGNAVSNDVFYVPETNADAVFYANFETISYNINYVLVGGTNDDSNPDSYTVEDTPITLEAPSRLGYNFVEWHDEYGDATGGIDAGGTGDREFTAIWEAAEYKIEYVLDGGTNHADNPSSYTIEDTPITLGNPTRPGYDFVKWIDEKGEDTYGIDAGTTGNRVFTAIWSDANDFTIRYIMRGGTNNPANPYTYTVEDTPIILGAPTRPGYAFVSWLDEEGGVTTGIPAGGTGNREFIATWAVIRYKIEYELDGGTNHASNPSSYTIRETPITLKDPTRPGSIFLGWLDEDGIATTGISAGGTGNRVFTAVWLADSGTKTISSQVMAYAVDDDIAYAVTYKLPVDVSLITSIVVSDSYPDALQYSSATVTVGSYTASLTGVDASGTVTITIDPSSLKPSAELVVTLNFKVLDASGSITNNASITINDDIKPGIDPVTLYKVTYLGNGNDNGDVPVDENVYAEGATIIVLGDGSLVKAGYSFAGWRYSGTNYSDGNNLVMPANNIELVAQWQANLYNLSFAGNGATAGSMADEQHAINSVFALTANAFSRTGYTFGGWSSTPGSGALYTNRQAFGPMPANNVTLYAVWVPGTGTAYSIVHISTATGTALLTQNYTGTTGAVVAATVMTFAGYNYTPGYAGELRTGSIAADGSLVLRLYYTPVAGGPIIPLVEPDPDPGPGPGPDPDPEPTTTVQTLPNDPVAQTQLPEVEVPLAANIGAWALINLILTAIGGMGAIAALVLYFRKRRENETEEEANQRQARIAQAHAAGDLDYDEEADDNKKRFVGRIIAAVLVVVAVILFILTEDITLPMVIVDIWTIAHALIFVAQIVCWVIASRRKTVYAEDTDEELERAKQSESI